MRTDLIAWPIINQFINFLLYLSMKEGNNSSHNYYFTMLPAEQPEDTIMFLFLTFIDVDISI